MKPTPKGWLRFSSAVVYRDAAAAIDWLCDAFGFQIRLKVEGANGRIEHCELEYGEGLIMIAQEAAQSALRWKRDLKSPLSIDGANTQSIMVYVDDADAHCAHARSRGAHILEEPTSHDYGEDHWVDRSYAALDPEGHIWWIAQRVRDRRAG